MTLRRKTRIFVGMLAILSLMLTACGGSSQELPSFERMDELVQEFLSYPGTEGLDVSDDPYRFVVRDDIPIQAPIDGAGLKALAQDIARHSTISEEFVTELSDLILEILEPGDYIVEITWLVVSETFSTWGIVAQDGTFKFEPFMYMSPVSVVVE